MRPWARPGTRISGWVVRLPVRTGARSRRAPGRMARMGAEVALAALVIGASFVVAQVFGAPAPFPWRLPAPAAARPPAGAPSLAGPSEAPRAGAVPRSAAGVAPPPAARGPLAEVQFIGTGAAGAALVLSGGSAAMVDAGSAAVATEALQRLRAAGVNRLDALLLVRGGGAAVQGLPTLLRGIAARRVLVPGEQVEPLFREAVSAARAAAVPVATATRGTTLVVGHARLEWMWPPQGLGQPGAGGGSGLIRVQVGHVAILLAGSFDPAEEDALVRLGGPLRAQVLEVPGGGATGLSSAFLRAVAPRVAVVGDGSGDAEAAVVQQLASAGVAILHGDRLSDLSLTTDGRRVAVAFDPGPAEEPSAGPTGTSSPQG